MTESANLSHRYLVQLRCHEDAQDAASDRRMARLHALQTTVEVFGGEIEHFWTSPREYDLILVIKQPAHQVSFTSLEMALNATHFVRTARSMPLYLLDPPSDEPLAEWADDIGEDAILAWSSASFATSNSSPRSEPDSLEPINWDEF